MKNFLWLLFIVPTLCFAQEYVDNTNSAGLSSMQRAIDAQDIPRMEGLIKGGAGYHWWILEREKAPLINYAISNNKPKAIDFLLSKQTAADASSVLLAMEKTNYTLVKKLLEEYLTESKIEYINVPQIENTGRVTVIKEKVPVEIYNSNWSANYTLSNKSGEAQNFKVDLGTNIYKSMEKQLAKLVKKQKQQGEIIEYLSNFIGIETNIIIREQKREVEILITNMVQQSTNILIPYNLNKEKCTELALIAVEQNSSPMVDYFLDKGADINRGLLHHAAYYAHAAMVKHLLNKGADALKEYDVQYLLESYDNKTHTPTFVIESLLEDIAEEPQRIQESKQAIIKANKTIEIYKHAEDPLIVAYAKSTLEDAKESITEREKKLANDRKKLPVWKEILTILKKYEE